MAGIGHITQDWEPVVVRKKAPNAAAKKDEKAVNAARRAGAEIETLKKSTAGTNKAASSSTSLNTRKLDDETENLSRLEAPIESNPFDKLYVVCDLSIEFGPSSGAQLMNVELMNVSLACLNEYPSQICINDRVPTELKKAIMQARMDKKLTQSQLAQMINEKPQVIQEYESGKAIPNQQIITKLERTLGTKLRGKK
ncbi:Multiprotein-bridging factor 1a [Morus notabilis]|uniref:Multiprotein-bridging factor 1a n=1 Tax=Morus notabilis TaxID=981085 RepID=W9RNQ5_9ROSA|nr:Multiprotein-bridging factor 1a [Morus notabilis]